MTSREGGETEDKELLDRYRRASDSEGSTPSAAVRAAILAEGRRVAEELQKKGTRHTFDTARPAANDARWKITAFGTLGAALLAALIIAPRYWETLPSRKESAATPAAPMSEPAPAPPAASAPKAESAKPAAVAPKDEELSNSPAPVAAPLAAPPPPTTTNSIQANSVAQLSGSSRTAARAYAPSEEKKATSPASSADSSDSAPLFGRQPTSAGLRSAAESGNAALTAKLIDAGVSVDARDEEGRTPLMIAIAQGRLEIVRLLLQRGADPNAADYAGKRPLQMAADQNLNDIAALLRGAGAKY